MKKIALFLVMALVAGIINLTEASPQAKNKGSTDCKEMIIVKPAVNTAVKVSLPGDAYRVAMQMEICADDTKIGYATSMAMTTTVMNGTSYAQMPTTEMAQWRQSFSINTIAESAGTVMLNGANELKIWPTAFNMMICLNYSATELSKTLNGANVCAVKDGNSYNSYLSGENSENLLQTI